MLSRLVVLAGFTARSQAYLQALALAGIRRLTVLAYGAPPPSDQDTNSPTTAPVSVESWRGVTLPDLSIPLETTCRNAGWTLLHCPDREIGSANLHGALRDCEPSLVIFSGYGGQIVGKQLLEMGAPFLHVHAGALPDYRGSTTTYYSILERGDCAATAFLLRAGIDTGPIVAQRHYAAPPRGMDVDRLYDGAIRADLLVHALRQIERDDTVPAVEQSPGSGHTYYVIHPVLKHIALLSLSMTEAAL